MRLQYCQLLRSTQFTHNLRCAKLKDCFPVSAIDLGTIRCGDNFRSDFLHSIILLVVKAFQRQETQFSPPRNMQQEQKSLTIYWTAWIVLPWTMGTTCILSSFTEHSFIHSPSTTIWARVDSQKTGSRLERQRRLQKPSTCMGTHEQWWAANDTQYIFSSEMSSSDGAYTGHGSLVTHSQVINTAGLHSDYPFLSGVQAQEIQLGSPALSSWEVWCGHETTLCLGLPAFTKTTTHSYLQPVN